MLYYMPHGGPGKELGVKRAFFKEYAWHYIRTKRFQKMAKKCMVP